MLIEKINDFISKTKNLNVAVIGETIIDEFIEVTNEGNSMKSVCPVIKIGDKTHLKQQGGSAAIVSHLKSFVKNVDFFTNENEEIIKSRYIDVFDKRKYIEINQFNLNSLPNFKIDTSKYDITIVADFGHGLCENLEINNGFHLMCQTNSNNFGFNRISKWKNFSKKSVCLDLREASLQLNKKLIGTDKEIKELYEYELNTRDLFLTLGGEGSLYYNGNQYIKSQSFPSQIVDTIGAGDTYFAFATLISHLNSDLKDLTIPSLAASLSTTWICNEENVTPEKLLKYAQKFI